MIFPSLHHRNDDGKRVSTIYLEKEISFSRSLLMSFRHDLAFYLTTAVILLFIFSLSFSITLYKLSHIDCMRSVLPIVLSQQTVKKIFTIQY